MYENKQVWIVVERSFFDCEGNKHSYLSDLPPKRHYVDLEVLSVCSSKDKATRFIKKALDDNNSGIENNTVLDIWIEEIDGYFSTTEIIDTKPALEWLSNETERV